MEGKGRFVSMEYEAQAAPFVAKTYEMVNDRRTDEWIRWGKENNSFLVLDPVEFSQLLLPCYFKHKNFSSFVRQLNTYGFRKVDPDRWEFAHESFLRGETRLLALISRRRNNNNNSNSSSSSSYHSNSSGNNYLSVVKDIVGEEEMAEEMLIQELRRLRQEQKALEEELQGMDRRLQATEMRPRKMMSFLAKVVKDPDLLSRLMVSKKQEFVSKKKRRIVISPTVPAPPPPPATVQGLVYSPIETLNASCEVDAGGKIHAAQQLSIIGVDPNTSQSQIKLMSEFELNYEPNSMAAKEVPFPFSILGHCFF
ncbi:heat stress transcription factor C-1b-like [Typha latifolia]|uniref:heat stress transcription factor C-1b-like n=1 Tax=Typha latifolia TaxID=4733 RepID=UPI003C2ED8BA